MGRGITPQTARKIRAAKGLRESKLYKVRLDKGLSQEQLARKAGVPVRTIRNYEQSKGALEHAKFTTLCDICLALNCGFQDIIESDKLIAKLRIIEGKEGNHVHHRENYHKDGQNDL